MSVIIPSYNRFDDLLRAISSVKSQTYPNVEVVVINDCSSDERYYKYKFEGCIVVHLPKNTTAIFGRVAPGYVRNYGIKVASGEYIAFLDDDDIWLPNKLTYQIAEMKRLGASISCTDGFIGRGVYDERSEGGYPKFNGEYHKEILHRIFRNKGAEHMLLADGHLPDVFGHEFMKVHNCCVASSVVVKRSAVDNCDGEWFGYGVADLGREDYNLWLRISRVFDVHYFKDVTFYYNNRH